MNHICPAPKFSPVLLRDVTSHRAYRPVTGLNLQIKPCPFTPGAVNVRIVSLLSKVGSALRINRFVCTTSTAFPLVASTNPSIVTVDPKSNSTQVPLLGSVVKAAFTSPCESDAY